MMKANSKPLKLALHDMEIRSIKTMMLFLQGPCEGAAIVVNEAIDADVDVFDADVPASKKLLEKRLQERMLRPVIVLALKESTQEGVLSLTKPINKNDMLFVLDQAKILVGELSKKTLDSATMSTSDDLDKDFLDLMNDELFDYISASSWDEPQVEQGEPEILRVAKEPEKLTPQAPAKILDSNNSTHSQAPQAQPIEQVSSSVSLVASSDLPTTESQTTDDIGQPSAENYKPELKTFVMDQERKKTSKHQTAMLLDEKGFSDHIGKLDTINVNDPKQFGNAHYNPKDYLQGYVQSALHISKEKNHPVLLETQWCPIALFPSTKEIWLDARDSELNAFAELKLRHKTMGSQIAISAIDPEKINFNDALDKFQNADTFLWKLACWTSKGRYPQDIDYRLPVYLSSWPNFTRLLNTPHALRIAALLMKGPRTMTNVAEMLNIKPQYVFVFISAAHAIGLAGQAKRNSDNLVQPPDVKPSKGQGLLSRIMSRLRS